MVESMQMTAAVTQQVLNEVNAFLETQTAYVQDALKRLDDLRGAVVRRDEGALTALFDQVRQETERKEQSDQALLLFRFNRLLLNSLCGNRQEMTTYDARGMNRWSVQGGLMNVRF